MANEDFDSKIIEKAIENLLRAVGVNPNREGLLQTPERLASMCQELLAGYRRDLSELINNVVFAARLLNF